MGSFWTTGLQRFCICNWKRCGNERKQGLLGLVSGSTTNSCMTLGKSKSISDLSLPSEKMGVVTLNQALRYPRFHSYMSPQSAETSESLLYPSVGSSFPLPTSTSPYTSTVTHAHSSVLERVTTCSWPLSRQVCAGLIHHGIILLITWCFPWDTLLAFNQEIELLLKQHTHTLKPDFSISCHIQLAHN